MADIDIKKALANKKTYHEPISIWAKIGMVSALLFFGSFFTLIAYIVITGPSDEEVAAQKQVEANAAAADWLVKTQTQSSQISIDDYAKHCASVPDDIHAQRCRGKWIVWDVFVQRILNNDELRVQTHITGGLGFDVDLRDPVNWEGPLEGFVLTKFRIAGYIDDPHTLNDDIRDAAIVSRLEYTPEETLALRVAQEQKELEEKALMAYSQCKTTLRQVAKFPSEVDCPFIPDYRAFQTNSGIRVLGVCGMMNGFGNVVPHTFECIVNDGVVTGITAEPGG